MGDGCESSLIGSGNEHFILDKVKSCWYRGGWLHLGVNVKSHNEATGRFLLKEQRVILDFIYKKLENVPVVIGGFREEIYESKLNSLVEAKKSGLNIPNTIVTSCKFELMEFVNKFSKVIAKPLGDPGLIVKNGIKHYVGSSYLVQESDLSILPDNSFPNLFQEYIDKYIEIRILFIGMKLFSMAIFSQLDEKTMFDYKNYNFNKPNRLVPFTLPRELKLKLENFIIHSDLTSGSIDLILTPKGKYYFLEVNPTGQFDWLSKNCNFYVEKYIAKTLESW